MEAGVARLELGQGAPRGRRRVPTLPRGKSGTKRHILTDQGGTPLSAFITGANVHDMKAVLDTTDAIVVRRPYYPQHLCLIEGYDFPEIEMGAIDRKDIPHIRHRGEDPSDVVKCHQPKRWVVERSASWLNLYRKLPIRWEKKAEN